MKLVFASQAWEDYLHWQAIDLTALRRVNELVADCIRSPFNGIGKPEPLRGDRQGWRSRRVTHGDRLVYRVSGKGDAQQLEIAQCRFHY